jgi:hypothetical protein
LNLFIASNNDYVVNEIEDNHGMKRQLGREEFPSENVNIFYNNGSIASSNENLQSYSQIQKTNTKSTFSKASFQNTNQQTQGNTNKTSLPPTNSQSGSSKHISKSSNTLNQKRVREDVTQRNSGSFEINKTENAKSSSNVQKFNLINPENLANLQSIFPLNLLSQNMGVINWVVPSDVLKNNVSNLDEKTDKV